MKGIAACLIAVLAVGCSSTTPTSPTKTSASTITGPGTGTGWTTSGTVWIYEQGTRQAARSGHVYGWVDTANGGSATGVLPIGRDGRYSFPMGTGTTRVWVTPSSFGYQPCLTTVVPSGNVSVDAYYVTDNNLLGAHLPQELIDLGPTLSGQIYEETPTGRVPAANLWIYLDGLYGDDLVVATTLTDSDGRYTFCNMQNLPQLVLVAGGGPFDWYTSPPGVGSKTMLDIEVRRKRP